MRRYFEEEMRYLHEAGKAFAEAHPEQARFLNVDSVTDRDPYVERLFEGFAFLAGRIHERLDDELPEYTESLLSLLYPHFLRPIPALAVSEFKPKLGQVSEATVLERGTEVRTGPVGDERAVCRFMTTEEVVLRPMALDRVELNWPGDGTSSLSLTFLLDRGVSFSDLRLSCLPLHFHADPSIASAMHMFLTRHVQRVSVSAGTADGPAFELLGQQWVRPGGLSEQESLLPESEYTFSGFRLLHEYLNYRTRFWRVDLYGLERLEAVEDADSFSIRIDLNREYPEDKRFDARNVKLHCAPVVNIFVDDAEPIRVEHRESEYRVIASTRYRKSMDIYDVVGVVGVEERTGRKQEYFPFYRFARVLEKDRRYFTQSFRQSADGRSTYLSIVEDEVTVGDAKTEVLSVDIRCSNGSLPREKVQEKAINQLAPNVPQIAETANLNQPSLIRYPPGDRKGGFFWQLISHFSLNFLSVATRDALTTILSLYDWSDSDANRRRIRGVRSVSWTPKEVAHRGAVMRGAEVTIELEEDHFADEGDICLFGLIISEFFSAYATINSFVHTRLITYPSERSYEWRPTQGIKPSL